MNMKEWFLGNISNIDSVISIITSILGGIAFVGGAIVKLLKILFQVKVESKKSTIICVRMIMKLKNP